jgi:hypothetical protein
MSRVISVRVSEAEEARIRGAAAIAGMPISAYLKWLITNGRTGTQNDAEMILKRLDDIAAAIANLRSAPAPMPLFPAIPARSAIVSRLRERGLPSSTIRQVEAVLDDLEGKAARAPVAA